MVRRGLRESYEWMAEANGAANTMLAGTKGLHGIVKSIAEESNVGNRSKVIELVGELAPLVEKLLAGWERLKVVQEAVEINGFSIPRSIWGHLGNSRMDARVVVNDLVSANIFDLDDMDEIVRTLKGAAYFESLEEYNAKRGTDLTEEDLEGAFEYGRLIELSSADGFVEIL